MWNVPDEEFIRERYELVRERILQIPEESALSEHYLDYFVKGAQFLARTITIFEKKLDGTLADRSLEVCQSDHAALYAHIHPEHYASSYANPDHAVHIFGEKTGQLLTLLCSEMESCISYAFQGKMQELTIMLELFVQVYSCFCMDSEQDALQEANQTIYWFFHDYSEIFVENQVRNMIHPDDNFFTDLVMKADLNDLRYLYQYGLPVSENELGIAAFLNQMSDEQVQSMADTFTEGYRIGFQMTGKDISIKKSVQIHYQIGFERMIRKAIENFRRIGLEPTMSREPESSFNGKGTSKRAVYSTSVNRQYDFDHREDRAFYFDKAFVERRLEVLRTTFEQNKEEARLLGGPAVLEVFGEEPFSPRFKDTAIRYDDKQQQLNVRNASESGQITNQYVPGEERSFTIIAYPIPAIGEKFQEIFAETAIINTLPYEKYQRIQQCLIDQLDQAEYVEIKGTGINRTDLKVAICPLADPSKETAFENCVADVNIPVGEVFTSPVLKGTNGVLHVSEVFLNGLQFIDLEIVFKDGMIDSYRCGNFDSEEEGKEYIKNNVLMHHDTLPMGEFAIGTNTTAYKMGRDYQIADKLPILIAEKTGPHFAVGDTCYSHEEDTMTYNPDGKAIVARSNEISDLRKEDMTKAYFNCHTDITIPYDELGAVTVVKKDGSTINIIRDGLFQVKGTEDLNLPLEKL